MLEASRASCLPFFSTMTMAIVLRLSRPSASRRTSRWYE